MHMRQGMSLSKCQLDIWQMARLYMQPRFMLPKKYKQDALEVRKARRHDALYGDGDDDDDRPGCSCSMVPYFCECYDCRARRNLCYKPSFNSRWELPWLENMMRAYEMAMEERLGVERDIVKAARRKADERLRRQEDPDSASQHETNIEWSS